jgi:hypothetical protein
MFISSGIGSNCRSACSQVFLKFHLKNTDIAYMTNQEKAYVKLNKYFLAIQTKLTRYKMAGQSPPDYLLQHFEDTKRKLRIFSKAFEK